jgi:hypothetical protein
MHHHAHDHARFVRTIAPRMIDALHDRAVPWFQQTLVGVGDEVNFATRDRELRPDRSAIYSQGDYQSRSAFGPG